MQGDNTSTILSGTELITNGTKTFSSGKHTYSFSYTAPASTGSQTIYATGMSNNSSNQWNFAPNKTVKIVSTISGINNEPGLPSDFLLFQNYPNPFNPNTTIVFSLPKQTQVVGEVIDLQGRIIEKLFDGTLIAGQHRVQWNAGKLINGFPSTNGHVSGIYFFRLSTTESIKIIKMLLLK